MTCRSHPHQQRHEVGVCLTLVIIFCRSRHWGWCSHQVPFRLNEVLFNPRRLQSHRTTDPGSPLCKWYCTCRIHRKVHTSPVPKENLSRCSSSLILDVLPYQIRVPIKKLTTDLQTKHLAALDKRVWNNKHHKTSIKVRAYGVVVLRTLLCGSDSWVLYCNHLRLHERFLSHPLHLL